MWSDRFRHGGQEITRELKQCRLISKAGDGFFLFYFIYQDS
jgi:hypothetical protein